jgi:molybdopterin-guanine dinucleotide biosynthesis protein A
VDAQVAVSRVVAAGDRGAVIAAIIAGGMAERLGGQLKASLVVGGERIIERQLRVITELFPRVIVAANDRDAWRHLGCDVHADRTPHAGPLAGIDAALAALDPGQEAVVCVAGDMPFLTEAALLLLRDHAPGADAVVARAHGLPQPLFARYHRRCAQAIARRLASGRLKTAALFEDVDAMWLDEDVLRRVDPDLAFLDNINTPDDLDLARRRAGS